MKSSKTSFLRNCISGWNVREPQNSEPMPPNFQQRAIFVYLRSKDDHKSCTPAGAKLTDEYTHRTNKNNPCTISVIPSQLCTFFRKRTISTWMFFIFHVGAF